MATNVTKEEIRKQLTIIFASAAKSASYFSNNEQYEGFCGWCGVMAPLSRLAFFKTFGEVVTIEAETGARADLENWRKEYQTSEWAAHKTEADRHEAEGQSVPAVGAYVWGLASWLKCDSGRGFIDEIENQEICAHSDDRESSPARVLLHVAKVVNVSADELNRPGLADELAAGGNLPGGGSYEDDEHMKMVAPYNLTFVNVAAVTDGTRYYYIDAEGYDYARYIIFPLAWTEFFAHQLETCRQKEAERKAAEEKAAEEEHAANLAAYIGRCKKWEKFMQPVGDLENELKAARYGTPEYKAARRKLQNVRRANILTMCRRAFPDVKFSLTKNDGWGESWNLTYTDGPTETAFMEAVDFDLFMTCRDTFNGWDDSTDVEYIADEFCTFAQTYMGSDGNKGVKVERKMSDETRAALRARVLQSVPGLPERDGIHRDNLTDEQREAVCDLVGNDWQRVWISADGLASELFDKMRLYSPAETSPNTADIDIKTDASEANGEQHGAASADGLTAEEYSEKATVVRGYTEAQYKELTDMGGKYNRRLKGGPGIIFSTKKHGAAVAEYIAAHSA